MRGRKGRSEKREWERKERVEGDWDADAVDGAADINSLFRGQWKMAYNEHCPSLLSSSCFDFWNKGNNKEAQIKDL